MSVAVCTIACARKIDAIYCLPRLFELEGDYELYINFESTVEPGVDGKAIEEKLFSRVRPFIGLDRKPQVSLDVWAWRTALGLNWRPKPKYDQDQHRLMPIVAARNMCIDFALYRKHDWLLFVDADVIPPKDILPKLLEVGQHDRPLVGAMVPGRGCHAHVMYVSYANQGSYFHGIPVLECHYGSCGAMLIRRDLFSAVRMRWCDGLSEDPAYGHDARQLFGQNGWMMLRQDTLCQHEGDLKANEVAGY